MTETYALLDLGASWARLNETILDLVGYVPDGKLDWSPQGDLWTFRAILSHIASTRQNWLTREGTSREDVLETVRTKADVITLLKESWLRVQRFLSDQKYLDRIYEGTREDIDYSYSGHWIAFHLLEHDVHHRADLFQYLHILGIEHPEVGTP